MHDIRLGGFFLPLRHLHFKCSAHLLPAAITGRMERASASRDISQREDIPMESLWLVLFWTGPIGVGLFLAGLGILFWGIGQVQKRKKE